MKSLSYSVSHPTPIRMSGLCIRPKKDHARAFKFGNKSNISVMNQNRKNYVGQSHIPWGFIK